MKKAFSLFEIIFVILIISIISSVAYQKIFSVVEKANYTKIKSEIVLINNAIANVYSSLVLTGVENFKLEQLDNANLNSAGESLFNGFEEFVLVDDVILSASEDEKKIGYWIKLSNSEYKIYLSTEEFLIFKFDSDKGYFSCDEKVDLCKELMF